ncbi:MAG TPA: bifunctional DNA-formamidopyrimidine glycosylase/DNA-(apurinic or apyrimidinic site) lyase [Acidobacteriota bacterium]|nr:bifunctional DNA-formamidopyrimidine glycosylase/DNA-(apurinic or apyrimidinic site) lyase [Acidobacteriota bacterium]
MPELPEVETIARRLRQTVAGKRIVDVLLSGKNLRKPIDPLFAETLRGRSIQSVLRRGKYLAVILEPRAFLLIHLGMSGKLLFHSRKCHVSKHTHAVFSFSDSSCLEYRDPRRFGMLAVHEVPGLEHVPEIGALGRDPLNPGFSGRWLDSMLKKSRRGIKPLLLDQRVIAGLGNIYACESLFMARIHPARICSTLSGEETANLVKAVKSVLRAAVKRKGTSFSDFIGADGKQGSNQQYLQVFRREGKSCFQCGAPIKRELQEGRSSFFCSDCQV